MKTMCDVHIYSSGNRICSTSPPLCKSDSLDVTHSCRHTNCKFFPAVGLQLELDPIIIQFSFLHKYVICPGKYDLILNLIKNDLNNIHVTNFKVDIYITQKLFRIERIIKIASEV